MVFADPGIDAEFQPLHPLYAGALDTHLVVYRSSQSGPDPASASRSWKGPQRPLSAREPNQVKGFHHRRSLTYFTRTTGMLALARTCSPP